MIRSTISRRGALAGLALAATSAVTAASRAQDTLLGNRMPYDAFDRMPKTEIAVDGGVIRVAFADGTLALGHDRIEAWIKASARAVARYYGRFPVASLRLLIVPVDGPRVRGGTTWAYRGAAIRVLLGNVASADDLQRDWIMVHEMVHLALPDMEERYDWLSEGLAVYVEPIARVQAGDLTANEIWAAMMRDMPKGLPASDDHGLDATPTWGRTYWGGAMFCLHADVAMRRESGNRLGLQDAMCGVLAAGGSHEQDWPIERILTTADRAVGMTVLTRLHDEWGHTPVSPDLDALWRDLGLRMRDGNLVFDDTAPLAEIRQAITRPRS